MFMIKVNIPIVSGALRLSTYGTLDIGDVPNKARVIRLTPKALNNSADAKTT
jgi:hypothetical protein